MARKSKALDLLGKVMSKVSRGLKLTRRERAILSGAIDGVKKAISEYGKKAKRRRRRR